jgi:glycosyltransferase involved in cell wall biosynthesis
MKIGVDINSLSFPRKTGIGRYTYAIVKEMLKIETSHEWYLYSAMPVDYAIKAEWRKYTNVVFHESHFGSRYLWQQMFLGRRLQRDKIDVHLAIDGLLPLWCKTPSVAVVHDLIWLHFSKEVAPHIYCVYRLRLKPSVREAKHCIAVSQATKDDVVKYTGVSSDKVTVLHEAAEEQFRVLSKDAVQDILQRHGLKSPYLLYVGNLMIHKNLERLLKAFRIVLDETEKRKSAVPILVIVGCGSWRSSAIFETVKSLKLEPWIKFLGYLDNIDLVAVYNGAEGLIFPSLIEGFGLPILEAQACGTPVTCSRSSSLPEVAGDSVLFFDPYNVKDIAEKMSLIHSDDTLRKELIKKGFENVKGFSWQKSAEQILPILAKASNVK